MEKINPVINLLQELDYSLSRGNSDPGFLHMYRQTNPPEFYPRYHLKIPFRDTDYEPSLIEFHIDQRPHRVSINSAEVRIATVSELEAIIKHLQAQNLNWDSGHPLLARLHYLLIFQQAESIHRSFSGKDSSFIRFLRMFKGRGNKHEKYIRDTSWKKEVKEYY